ncbi:hypothetical protein [Marivirga aurantiaca]|nr:hypothetical protein [Marivirga aurantiaca]
MSGVFISKCLAVRSFAVVLFLLWICKYLNDEKLRDHKKMKADG